MSHNSWTITIKSFDTHYPEWYRIFRLATIFCVVPTCRNSCRCCCRGCRRCSCRCSCRCGRRCGRLSRIWRRFSCHGRRCSTAVTRLNFGQELGFIHSRVLRIFGFQVRCEYHRWDWRQCWYLGRRLGT